MVTKIELVKKPLPQNPDIWVSVPNYKEPILPVSDGFGWYGLMAYDFQCDKLMCHECGKFFSSLGTHVKNHKLSGRTYKTKYGLLFNTVLCSFSHQEKLKSSMINRPDRIKFKEYIQKANLIRDITKASSKGHKMAIEKLNKFDTCPEQSLRWLKDAAQVYGNNISYNEANQFRPGLCSVLEKRWGTFNKAKQLINLVNNEAASSPTIYSKRLIIEDMIAFYRKYKRWATKKDYFNGLMICSINPIFRNGGIIKLRQEAMKLKDEQDKRAMINNKLPLIANQIEMENAGRARV